MYDKQDKERPDLYVDMLKAMQNTKTPKYENAVKMSVGTPVIPFRTTPKKKPINYKAILCSAALLLAISFGAKYIGERRDTQEAYFQSNDILAQVVSDNTHYGDYSGSERIWWYDTEKMALDVLDSSEYDIDTRIYGCYKNMKEYNKLTHMNSLFEEMQKIITANPDKYSEDIKAACSYETFQEYLDAKNLNLDDYQKLMDQVLVAYGKEDRNFEEIAALLNELNGTRDGGTR